MEAIYNLNEVKYQEAKIYGLDCLFSIDRILEGTYPDGLYKHELMYENGNPIILQEHVFVDFYGTLLTKDEIIDIENEDYYESNGIGGVLLHPGELEISNNFITMDDYMEG